MRPNGQWVKRRWANRRWSDRSTVLAVAVSTATITALAVGGIALADNVAESGNDATAATSDQPRPDAKDRPVMRGHRAPGLMGWALHGEFVTAKKDGGYQTVAVQHGEVQAVSDTSITVKSEDGYSRSYVVDDETLVNAHREGIGSVDEGDDVHVAAVVSGDTATALRVADVSDRRATWEKFRPRLRGLNPDTGN
ncbi:hypothetical protein ABN028_21945 [Actinopolymorpha sp. B17G11]|uniref:hypothetical protein n=1 Tax=unclassified Actinopolymorpha TaxID=2627063 RepID=UPI0032D95C45